LGCRSAKQDGKTGYKEFIGSNQSRMVTILKERMGVNLNNGGSRGNLRWRTGRQIAILRLQPHTWWHQCQHQSELGTAESIFRAYHQMSLRKDMGPHLRKPICTRVQGEQWTLSVSVDKERHHPGKRCINKSWTSLSRMTAMVGGQKFGTSLGKGEALS